MRKSLSKQEDHQTLFAAAAMCGGAAGFVRDVLVEVLCEDVAAKNSPSLEPRPACGCSWFAGIAAVKALRRTLESFLAFVPSGIAIIGDPSPLGCGYAEIAESAARLQLQTR